MTQLLEISSLLQKQLGANVGAEEVFPNVYRIYAPFFHEDGDMLSIYLDLSSDNMYLKDFGNALMRVAYTFDFESENKRRILNEIVKSYGGLLLDDEVCLLTSRDNLATSIYNFSQLIAKVSNISILQRELVKSLFFEYLDDYVSSELRDYDIEKACKPSSDKSLEVDYIIRAERPIFMFGVNSETKASKTIISCLSFQRDKIPFRSLVVHEGFDNLTAFSRSQITNTADKQFDSFDNFKKDALLYLAREIA